MNKSEKRIAVLKWLSLSGYPRTSQSFIHLSSKIKNKYPELNYRAWEHDLNSILDDLEKSELIGKEEHDVYIVHGEHNIETKKEWHYFSNFVGDVFVQELPNIAKEQHNDYVIEVVNLIIRYLPNHGFLDKDYLLTDLVPNSADSIFSVVASDDDILRRVFNYLIAEGYAEHRTDIKHNNNVYIELSDKGRKLKSATSIEKYLYQLHQECEEIDRRKKRDKNLYWINFWIAVGAVSAGLYYVMYMVDYLDKLFAKCPHLYYSRAVTIYLLLLGATIGACITIAVTQLRKAIQKKKANKSNQA